MSGIHYLRLPAIEGILFLPLSVLTVVPALQVYAKERFYTDDYGRDVYGDVECMPDLPPGRLDPLSACSGVPRWSAGCSEPPCILRQLPTA